MVGLRGATCGRRWRLGAAAARACAVLQRSAPCGECGAASEARCAVGVLPVGLAQDLLGVGSLDELARDPHSNVPLLLRDTPASKELHELLQQVRWQRSLVGGRQEEGRAAGDSNRAELHELLQQVRDERAVPLGMIAWGEEGLAGWAARDAAAGEVAGCPLDGVERRRGARGCWVDAERPPRLLPLSPRAGHQGKRQQEEQGAAPNTQARLNSAYQLAALWRSLPHLSPAPGR